MSDAKRTDYALGGAILRADAPFALSLVPRATPAGLTAALGDLVECAAAIDDPGGSRRWMPLRLIVEALMHADAGMPAPRNDVVYPAAGNARTFGLHLPVAGLVGWVWCVQTSVRDHGGWPSPAAAYASRTPVGIDDTLVASWAARRAAESPHESWAMRLLAALGATA